MSEEEDLARSKIINCKKHVNKEDRVNCMYEKLYDITKAQDITNLTIMKEIDNEKDERWLPIHMVDNANAVILGISRNKGKPKSIIKEGYTEDKLNGLDAKWNMLRLKFE